jgi:hypothetical protein
MQYRIASIDQFVDTATLNDIAGDPRDARLGLARCTRQRAHRET